MNVSLKAYQPQNRYTPELQTEVTEVGSRLGSHQDVVDIAESFSRLDNYGNIDRHPKLGEVNNDQGFLSYNRTSHRPGIWPLNLLREPVTTFEPVAMKVRTRQGDSITEANLYTRGEQVFTDVDVTNKNAGEFTIAEGTYRTEKLSPSEAPRTEYLSADTQWQTADGTAVSAGYGYYISGSSDNPRDEEYSIRFQPGAAFTPAQKAVEPKSKAIVESIEALVEGAKKLDQSNMWKKELEGEVPGFGHVKGYKDGGTYVLSNGSVEYRHSAYPGGDTYEVTDERTSFSQMVKIDKAGNWEYTERRETRAN